MKRSIYQKLLMTLAIVAFFGTLASAQVMSRTHVSQENIETAKLRHQQTKPKAVKKDAAMLAKMQQDIETKKKWKSMTEEERKDALKPQAKKVKLTEKKVVKKSTNIRTSSEIKQIGEYKIIVPPNNNGNKKMISKKKINQ